MVQLQKLLTHKPWRQYCTISVWITLSQIIIIYNPVLCHNESIFSNIQRVALAKGGVLLAWAAKYTTLYIKLSCDPKYDQRKDIKTGKKHDTMQYKQWANHHKINIIWQHALHISYQWMQTIHSQMLPKTIIPVIKQTHWNPHHAALVSNLFWWKEFFVRRDRKREKWETETERKRETENDRNRDPDIKETDRWDEHDLTGRN